MSFDTPTDNRDLAAIASFCKLLYRKCRDAGGDYEEISHEILALYKVLSNLFSADNNKKINDRDLERILQECNSGLRQLDGILLTQGTHNGGRVGSNEEMEQLGECRVRLISLRGKLGRFGGGDGDEEDGQGEGEDGELDGILDLVDEIAARLGKARMGGEDDTGRWRVFRREMLLDGRVEESVLGRCKEVVISYIREIYNNQTANGNIQQDNSTRKLNESKQEDVNRDHWLPSHSSYHNHIAQTQEGKALSPLVQEENLKFPTSMKYAPRVPEPRTASTETRTKVQAINTNTLHNGRGNQRENSSSSSDDRNHEVRRNEERGLVIRTSDLVARNKGNIGPLLLQAPPSPSSSFRTHTTDSTIGRNFGYGPSPVSIPSHPPHSQTSLQNKNQSHQEEQLAPDTNGNPIPPNAKWTKITRRLISPEVLQKRGIRYEARPEWVAILGELRREEIEELARASAWVRDERERLRTGDDTRERGGGNENASRSPLNHKSHTRYLPIPIPIPIPGGGEGERSKSTAAVSSLGRDRGQKTYSTTDSDSDLDSYSGSDSETETEDERSHHRRQYHGKHRRYHQNNNSTKKPGYQGSDIGVPISGYPNPFGQPVPFAPLSPAVSFVGPASSSTRDRERAFENIPRSAPPGNGVGVRFSDMDIAGSPRSAVGGFGARDRDRDQKPDTSKERQKEREREREPDRAFYTYASHSPSSPPSHHWAGGKGKGERGERDREREPRKYKDENYGYNHSSHNSYNNDGYGNGNGERRKKHYNREPGTSHSHREKRDRDVRSKEKGMESSSRGEKGRERESSRGGGGEKASNAKGRSSGSRWKENLTAAGIGGAAVSLLNVLSEAAEGL